MINKMERKEVDSSNINSVGYSEEKELLEIEFNTGKVYQYEGIEPKLASDLISAESVGKFFHEHIKKGFKGVAVEEEE